MKERAGAVLPTALRGLVRFDRGEGPAVLWAFAYFFCLLSSYYIIRPLRDEMGVAAGGEEKLAWLYMGTLAGTLVANPIFAALVTKYPRRIFIPVVYRFLILNLLVFYALFGGLTGGAYVLLARVFFVWTSVFNLFAVSVFWGFMADCFRSEQGKRLFGFIGLGGTLGAVAGAASTAALAETVGPVNLLLLSGALLEAAVFCVRRLARIFQRAGPAPAAGQPARAEADAPPGHGFLRGIRLVFASPYLLGICLFLFFYTVSSTFVYFEQTRIARTTFADPGQRTAFFASIDLYVNALTVLTQAFFTGRIIGAIGVGATLALFPCLTAAGFAWLGLSPVAATLVGFQVVRRAMEYALIRPAREVLFTVVSREEKYSSKNFIDTFVYRGGDAIAAWSNRLLAAFSLGTAGIALSFLPLAAVWLVVAIFLGRRQAALARVQAVQAASS